MSGADGSNECPAGSVRIETEAACSTAAAAAGKPVASGIVGTFPGYPRGCYYYTGSGGSAYFNPHVSGAGRAGYQLLCAAVTTTGAPLTPL